MILYRVQPHPRRHSFCQHPSAQSNGSSDNFHPSFSSPPCFCLQPWRPSITPTSTSTTSAPPRPPLSTTTCPTCRSPTSRLHPLRRTAPSNAMLALFAMTCLRTTTLRLQRLHLAPCPPPLLAMSPFATFASPRSESWRFRSACCFGLCSVSSPTVEITFDVLGRFVGFHHLQRSFNADLRRRQCVL